MAHAGGGSMRMDGGGSIKVRAEGGLEWAAAAQGARALGLSAQAPPAGPPAPWIRAARACGCKLEAWSTDRQTARVCLPLAIACPPQAGSFAGASEAGSQASAARHDQEKRELARLGILLPTDAA